MIAYASYDTSSYEWLHHVMSGLRCGLRCGLQG